MPDAFESIIRTSRGAIVVWVREVDIGYVAKVDGRRYAELSAVQSTGLLAMTPEEALRQYLEAIEAHWAESSGT